MEGTASTAGVGGVAGTSLDSAELELNAEEEEPVE